jgi:hypothetical protein
MPSLVQASESIGDSPATLSKSYYQQLHGAILVPSFTNVNARAASTMLGFLAPSQCPASESRPTWLCQDKGGTPASLPETTCNAGRSPVRSSVVHSRARLALVHRHITAYLTNHEPRLERQQGTSTPLIHLDVHQGQLSAIQRPDPRRSFVRVHEISRDSTASLGAGAP